MLNENIKEYYKGKLFEEVLNEAPIRYNMPQVAGRGGRAIVRTLSELFEAWKQALRAAGWTDDQIMDLLGILHHLDGTRGTRYGTALDIFLRGGWIRARVLPNGRTVYEIFNQQTNKWELWTFTPDRGPMGWQMPKGWQPGQPYNFGLGGADSDVTKYLIRPALGIIPAGVAPILHPALDPDSPDFNPGDYYVPDEGPMPADGGMYAGGGNYNGGGYMG